jgi:hypothetical protein
MYNKQRQQLGGIAHTLPGSLKVALRQHVMLVKSPLTSSGQNNSQQSAGNQSSTQQE